MPDDDALAVRLSADVTLSLRSQEEVTLAVLSRLTLPQLKEVGVASLGARLRIVEAFQARPPH